MATIKRVWSDKTQIIGSGDGWVTLSGTTPQQSSVVDLVTSGYVGIEIQPEVNFQSSPTDDVDVKIYGGLDASNLDDTPLTSVRIDNGTDPNQITIILDPAPAYLRVDMVQTGSTDNNNQVRCYYRAWRYQTE